MRRAPEPESRGALDDLGPDLRDRVLGLEEPVARDDWTDVVRRSRDQAHRPRRRSAATVAALVGVAAAVAAALLGALLPSSPGGSSPQLAAGPDRTAAPPAVAASTCILVSARPGAGGETLAVLPTREQRPCSVRTGAARGCDLRANSLCVAWGGGRVVVGAVSPAAVFFVRVRFTDGTSARPHIAWVSTPVSAGVFRYTIPPGKTVAAIIADEGGPTRRVTWYSV